MGNKEAQVDWDDDGFLDIDECCEKVRWLHVRIGQLRRELHDERVQRDEWEKMNNRLIVGTEVEHLQERLGQVKTTLDHEVDSRVRAELVVERSQAELDQVRQDAQDQSDEMQELWLSPCEAEGLRRQLARAQIQAAAPKKAVEWLWGFWDGNTLVAKPGCEDDIREAWDELLMARASTPLE